MKLILFTLLFLFTGCQKKQETPVQDPDPIYGRWIYKASETDTNTRGMAADIKPDGQLTTLHLYAESNGTSSVVYFRKSVGEFVRDGEHFSIKYSYETCNPVGSEELLISIIDKDTLRVSNKDQSVIVMMKRQQVLSESSEYSSLGVEDKNCNILAKLQKTSRVPASTK